jgi:hypothetical protein
MSKHTVYLTMTVQISAEVYAEDEAEAIDTAFHYFNDNVETYPASHNGSEMIGLAYDTPLLDVNYDSWEITVD